MAQKRLNFFSIFWVFSAMRTWVSMFFLELGPGRSIAIIIGMKKKLMQIHVGLALNLECKKAGDVRKSSRMVGPQ